MKLERQAGGHGWGLSVCRVDSKRVGKGRWEAAKAVHVGDEGDLGQGGSTGGEKWMHLSEPVVALTGSLMEGRGLKVAFSLHLRLFKLWVKGNLRG